MPWPSTTLLSFKEIPFNSLENEYQGPWNGILTTLFPPDSEFVVAPQYYRALADDDRWAVEFVIAFDIKFRNLPVLTVELSRPAALNSVLAREQAVQQIRARFMDYGDWCPISTLHAISVMGTQMAFYRLKKPQAVVNPRYIPRDPESANSAVPREQWSLDVLSKEGEAKIRRVAEEIKAECTTLG